MARKQHNLDEVLRSLSRKNGCSVDSIRRTVSIKRGQSDIGNGSWGKIDYLEKRHGYVVYNNFEA